MTRQGSVLGRAAIALAVSLLGTTVLAVPAYADTGEEAATEACWLNLDNDELRCFDTREDVFAAIEASGSIVRFDADADEPTAGRGDFGLLTTYFLATFWVDASYLGSSLDITTTNSWMCSGTDYNGNMPGGWNDVVSSFQSYGGCRTRLASNINQGGTFYGPFTSSASLGAANDTASSYRVMD